MKTVRQNRFNSEIVIVTSRRRTPFFPSVGEVIIGSPAPRRRHLSGTNQEAGDLRAEVRPDGSVWTGRHGELTIRGHLEPGDYIVGFGRWRGPVSSVKKGKAHHGMLEAFQVGDNLFVANRWINPLRGEDYYQWRQVFRGKAGVFPQMEEGVYWDWRSLGIYSGQDLSGYEFARFRAICP